MKAEAIKKLLAELADLKVLDADSPEIKTLAKAFKEGEGSPIAKAWEKVLKMVLGSNAWEATHIPPGVTGTEKSERITFLNGKAALAEALLKLPDVYIGIAEEDEKGTRDQGQDAREGKKKV